MANEQETITSRLPYDIDNNSQINSKPKESLMKRHIISVIFTFFLLIIFILVIIYVIIMSSAQVSPLLLSASQSQLLLGSGTYTSFTSNAEQFNVSSGSYISILLGNSTAYVSEYYKSKYYYQELIINRTNSSTPFSIVRFDMSHQLDRLNITNGTAGGFNFFYSNQNINDTSNVFTFIGRKNNTLVILSMVYNNTSINNTIKYMISDLNK